MITYKMQGTSTLDKLIEMMQKVKTTGQRDTILVEAKASGLLHDEINKEILLSYFKQQDSPSIFTL